MNNYSTPSSMHWISTLCAHVLRWEKGEWTRGKGRVKEGGGAGDGRWGEGEKGRWKRGKGRVELEEGGKRGGALVQSL